MPPQPMIRPSSPEQPGQTRWCIAGDDVIEACDAYWQRWMGAVAGDLVDRTNPIVASYIRDMELGFD